MLVAYLILAHHLPAQLARLVNRLQEPEATFLIHIDRNADDAAFAPHLRAIRSDNVSFLPRHRCNWGNFSIVSATLSGLQIALRASPRFDYLILLSGQDYPIKPLAHRGSTLLEANGHSFIHHVPFPTPFWKDGGWDRIRRWHMTPGLRNRLLQKAVKFARLRRRLPGGIRPYGGAQFWCMSWEAAAYVDAFVRQNPETVRFFHHVYVPDEVFFQTILGNPRFARV